MSDPSAFSDLSCCFWAKTSQDPEGNSGFGLSVVQHAIDVASIIMPLAEQLVSASTLRKLRSSVGKVSLEKLLQFLAMVHDVGKISSNFQLKVSPACKYLPDSLKFGISADDMTIRHEQISGVTVSHWLELRATKSSRVALKTWKQLLAGHHGRFALSADLQSLELTLNHPPTAMYDPNIEYLQARLDFIDQVAEYLSLDQATVDAYANISLATADLTLIEAILIVADWIGSGSFPLLGNNVPLSTSMNQARTEEVLAKVDIGGGWVPIPVTDASFAKRAGLPPDRRMNPLQAEAKLIAECVNTPQFILIEDQTGGGKTEAALAMADILAQNLNLNGIFLAQPTRITSDYMLQRMIRWESFVEFEDIDVELAKPVSTVLAHGKARLNPLFQRLTADSQNIFDEPVGRGIAAQSWFRGRKTNLLAHLVVGTIDQLLFAALPSKHLVLRHLGLSGKVVIIDELHASDAWMRTFLKRVLHWLAVYGVPVIGLSATLAPDIRQDLIDAYQSGLKGFSGEIAWPDVDKYSYPRITCAGVDAVGVSVIDKNNDTESKVTTFSYLSTEVTGRDADDLEHLAQHILSNFNCGIVGVVCNTVTRAQDLYRLVTTLVADNAAESRPEVILLHSRFPADLRAEKEARLVSSLGRQILGEYQDTERTCRPSYPNGCIVISTQIIEQGLDLDFDVMYTDLAPIDLLVQRIGRLHRHKDLNKFRPKAHQSPHVFIFGVAYSEQAEPEINQGSLHVYRALPLLRSLAVLRNFHGRISSPDDIAHLIVDGYSDELQYPEAWAELWERSVDAENNHEQRQVDYSSRLLLPESRHKVSVWAEQEYSDSETARYATVRDADDSLEVILCYRNESGHICALPHVVELRDLTLDGAIDIAEDVAERLAKCVIRLPSWIATDDVVATLEKAWLPNWQRSGWLAGELPLILNCQFQTTLGNWDLSFDEAVGLVARERKENF